MNSRCLCALFAICFLSDGLVCLTLRDVDFERAAHSGEVINTYGFSEHILEMARFLSPILRNHNKRLSLDIQTWCP